MAVMIIAAAAARSRCQRLLTAQRRREIWTRAAGVSRRFCRNKGTPIDSRRDLPLGRSILPSIRRTKPIQPLKMTRVALGQLLDRLERPPEGAQPAATHN